MMEYTFAFYKDEKFKFNKSFRTELKSDAFRQADIYMQNHDCDDWEILED